MAVFAVYYLDVNINPASVPHGREHAHPGDQRRPPAEPAKTACRRLVTRLYFLGMSQPNDPGHLTELNRRHWDERVPINAGSAFYDLDGFRAGDDDLDAFQVEEVGDVTDLDLAHLQCHIGLDTLAWARRGARVSGLDFSEPAIDTAAALATQIGLDHRARFVTADAYDAVEALGAHAFDLVYTGTGALMWLPDINRWARTVAGLLRPGGRLYVAEFHPLNDVMDDEEGTSVVRDYFTRDARTYQSPGSYADWNAKTTHNTATEWHHTLGDVVSAVAGAGLRVEFLHEHGTAAFQRYGALVADGTRFRYPDDSRRLPLTYSLAASAPTG